MDLIILVGFILLVLAVFSDSFKFILLIYVFGLTLASMVEVIVWDDENNPTLHMNRIHEIAEESKQP